MSAFPDGPGVIVDVTSNREALTSHVARGRRPRAERLAGRSPRRARGRNLKQNSKFQNPPRPAPFHHFFSTARLLHSFRASRYSVTAAVESANIALFHGSRPLVPGHVLPSLRSARILPRRDLVHGLAQLRDRRFSSSLDDSRQGRALRLQVTASHTSSLVGQHTNNYCINLLSFPLSSCVYHPPQFNRRFPLPFISLILVYHLESGLPSLL